MHRHTPLFARLRRHLLRNSRARVNQTSPVQSDAARLQRLQAMQLMTLASHLSFHGVKLVLVPPHQEDFFWTFQYIPGSTNCSHHSGYQLISLVIGSIASHRVVRWHSRNLTSK